MKILILANHDGGLISFRRELLEVLLQEHEVLCCTPPGEAVAAIESIGCRFVPCGLLQRRGTDPLKDLKLYYFYRKLLTAERPDIVLTYTIKPNVYGGMACASLHIPYMANVTGLGTAIENGGLLAGITTKLYAIGLRKASCVFFQNEENRGLFCSRRIFRGHSRLIPGSGVNLEKHFFEPYPSDGSPVRFLFVGRVMRDKGINELLGAIRRLHEENVPAALDVVGFCEESFEEALKTAEEEGLLIFHGPQSDVHRYYRDCHCCVMPSYHEGMSNVLLEASSTGRPVIATRVPGCRETFDEGISGFGCDARSTESLADAMRRFVSIPNEQRAAMGTAARAKMEREFDRGLVTKAYLEEMETAIPASD